MCGGRGWGRRPLCIPLGSPWRREIERILVLKREWNERERESFEKEEERKSFYRERRLWNLKERKQGGSFCFKNGGPQIINKKK